MSKIEEKNNRELKFEPMGGALSWRDIVRNFVLDKYGLTGKRLADSLIGASEEDMALNYLQRTYGSELPEGVNVNRPMSDMLKYGVSDFGLLDLGLLGMSGGASALPKGVGTTAAALETGALVGDAVGEYEKGNTLAASIMGGLAATPAILRYGVGTRNTPTETEFNPSRRKFMKDAGVLTGGIAALSMLPPAFRGAGKITAKLTPPIKSMLDHTNVFFYNNDIVDTLVSKYGKADEFTSSTEVEEILTRLASKDLNNLTLEQIKEIAGTSKNVEVTDDFLKDAINTIENLKSAVRNDPATKEQLDKLIKLSDMSEDEIYDIYDRGADTVHYDTMDDVREAFENYKP